MTRRPRTRLQAWQMIWPHVPIALLIMAAGILNLVVGLQAGGLLRVVQGAADSFGNQVSVSILGGGAQVIFGAGLTLTALGLFWRVRVAWTFAVLLVLVVVGINLARGHYSGALIVPGIMFLALIVFQRHFWRQTMLGTGLVSIVGVIAVMAYGTLGIYLLGDQFDPKITSMVTALYFLVETLSTTGYGDFSPVTETSQIFMITVWVVGLGVFGTAIVSVAGPIFANHLNRFFTPGKVRRMHKNHVILAGHGTIAANTANELIRRHIDFVQVVAADAEPPLPDHPVVQGDASNDKTLRKAGVDKARMLIAAEDEDGENAFISLAAKDANPNLNVLIVASSQAAIRRLKLAGADTVFAPAEVGSRLLANLIEGQSLPEQFGDLLDTLP